MATMIYDAACLCNDIYENGDATQRRDLWSLDARMNSPHDKPLWGKHKSDAYRLYSNGKSKIMVIRGSDVASDWTKNNLKIGVDLNPAKLDEAYWTCFTWKNMWSKSEFYVTGHSLGGGLTQVVAYFLDLPFVAFNPPPMRSSWSGALSIKPTAARMPKTKPQEFSKGVVVRKGGDPVSALPGKFIGKDVKLLETTGYSLHAHSMESIIAGIKGRGAPEIDRYKEIAHIAGPARS